MVFTRAAVKKVESIEKCIDDGQRVVDAHTKLADDAQKEKKLAETMIKKQFQCFSDHMGEGLATLEQMKIDELEESMDCFEEMAGFSARWREDMEGWRERARAMDRDMMAAKAVVMKQKRKMREELSDMLM